MSIQRNQNALRPVVAPFDEAPEPIAAPAEPIERRADGTVSGSDAARALAAIAVRKRASRSALVSALGLAELAADSEFRPYRIAGDEFVAAHGEELARVAFGHVGPGPMSVVASAGLQLAASRFIADKAAATGDVKLWHLASTLANDSRQNLLAAYELSVREAKARLAGGDDAHLYETKKEPSK